MKPKSFARFTALFALSCGWILATGGCRKGKTEAAANARPPAKIASELTMNNLGTLPGALYHTLASSPIHWQPWTKETFAHAKEANRLVFAVIVLPQQPGFQSTFKELDRDPAIVALINDNYAAIVIDGDASREMGILTAELSTESKRPLELPFFVWLTPEGNPVASIPVTRSPEQKGSGAAALFKSTHLQVSQIWAEGPDYVIKDSSLKNEDRRNRFAARKNVNLKTKQPTTEVISQSLRQLTSLYDTYSRSFDETGSLFPAGALDLLATAAMQPGLPQVDRERCLNLTQELLKDLLPSAMFDPLDGGVFTSRRGSSWALPAFNRNCSMQARAAIALFDAYRATGEVRALEKGLSLLAFSERSYSTPEGLFSLGMGDETDASAWLWSVEDIEKELPAEDAAWWIKATQMKNLGNLPSDVDTRREYFRSNSLGLSKSVSGLASEFGQSLETFLPNFEISRKKLLKARNARLGKLYRDDISQATASFRMVSAYAAAFSATGEEKYREKAVALLEKAKDSFSEGPKLRLFSQTTSSSIGGGRAFLYGVALQAAIDVSAITSEEKWLVWSEDLASTAAELFTGNQFLKECPADAQIIDLPVTDLVMLFDDSTAGLISFVECRMSDRERPLVPSFSELATPLPDYIARRPVLHTDLLQASIARDFKVSVICGTGLSPAMKLAVERLPIRMVQRRPAKPADAVPAGSVKVSFSSGETRTLSSPESLAQAVLPSGK